jgi:hypothetical protein
MDINLKYCVVKFTKFVKDNLGIEDPFKIKLTNQRDQDLITYAFYDKSKKIMKIYTGNRGLADVLRSLAHELVHHLQNQREELNLQHPDVGGQIEDEANAIAGQLVKKFGYENPDLLIYKKNFNNKN